MVIWSDGAEPLKERIVQRTGVVQQHSLLHILLADP